MDATLLEKKQFLELCRLQTIQISWLPGGPVAGAMGAGPGRLPGDPDQQLHDEQSPTGSRVRGTGDGVTALARHQTTCTLKRHEIL